MRLLEPPTKSDGNYDFVRSSAQRVFPLPVTMFLCCPSFKQSQLNQQLPGSWIDNDNKMHKKQIPSRTTILEQHVQAELARQQILSNYYQQILSATRQRKNKLELMDGNDIAVSVKNSSPHKKDNRNQSFMGKSNLSFAIQTPKDPKHPKSASHVGQPTAYGKNQPITFEAQYQSCVDSLSKTLASIAEKQHGTKKRKDLQKTSKTQSIVLGKTSKLARSALPKKAPTHLQSIKLKTDQSCSQLTKKQKIMLDIGDLSFLACEDEIINNLINNIKIEEERYVDLVLRSTETNVRQKMRNYIARQTEKYQEMLFKAKQEEAEKSLSSLKSNKETVKRGYTERMREVVDRGLRSTSFNAL